jgi:hypothetical protein
MSVDFQHPQYAEYLPIWEKCEDASCGQREVHEGGIKYLPKLSDQSDAEYKAYVQRASYFNATGRTVDGLTGMVMRKPPAIEGDAGLIAMLEDIDLQGTHINMLCGETLYEVLIKNRFGFLVEYPKVETLPRTVAEADAMQNRPYVTRYEAKHVTNWRVERINNVMMPVLVVLKEEFTEQVDEFEFKSFDQYRALKLTEGVYVQEIYRKDDKTKKWVLIDSQVPLMNGNPLSFIPFYIFGTGTNFECEKPLIEDLANLNLSHYRTSADYEHGAHFTGLPMLFFSGINDRDEKGNQSKIYLGSQTAVVASNPDADGKYIEFTGQGLDALKGLMELKEKQMAVLGARFLEQQKAGVEATQTLQLRQNGENSTLAELANIVSKQMTEMLNAFSAWAGYGAVKLTLNNDFMPVGLSSQDLSELMKAWQAGGISYETLFTNLKRGEIIDEGVTAEDERERIANETPSIAE